MQSAARTVERRTIPRTLPTQPDIPALFQIPPAPAVSKAPQALLTAINTTCSISSSSSRSRTTTTGNIGGSAAVCDVVGNGDVEERGILADEPHVAAQPAQVECGDAAAVQQHGSALRVVEALHQHHHRRLASPALPHQCYDLKCKREEREGGRRKEEEKGESVPGGEMTNSAT
ncbi:hypothetical protein CLOM_g4500 [Closterium sp. NIES-68]|nr:hypothetical protein CLOM_g4500 [Closterium sp. NIES-68]